MPVFDQERVDRLKQILKWHPRGITISDLAVKMEMNRNLVAKYLDILLISGQVEMQEIGAAKVYFLSHRVPISSMLEFSSDMLIILDSALTIIQVNEPLLVQINVKREALAGRTIRDIDHPFIKAIPVILPSKDTNPTYPQAREFECISEGMQHNYKIKQLQTAFEDGSQGITLIIEDITAQITYQKMLELNEAKYRGIVEDQTEFITRFLPDGTLVFVNDAYARYLGKEKEELLGKQHIPGIESEDITTVSQCIQSLDMNNPVQTFECRIHHSCGQIRWNLWTVRALFDDNQKPLEYQGVGRDNTEKREAATRINQYVRDMEFLSRKAQEFVEISTDANIFQVIGQGISEIIPDALITANSIDAESDTLTVRTVLPERDRETLKKTIGKDLLGFQFNISALPEPHKLQFFSTQEAGKLVRIEENLHTVFFQQIPQDTCDMIKKNLDLGDSLYTIGLARHGILFGNVSFSLRKGETLTNSSIIETYVRQAAVVLHRRRTDDALKASESRYRGIVEDQTEFVARFLPDGTLTYVNDSLCRFFFMVRTELLGQSFFSLSQIPKDDQNALIRDLQTLDARNPVCSTEFRIIDPPDGVRWTQWTYRALFDDHGTIIECQGVGRDITEQKEAEEKIRQYIADIEYLSQKSYEFLELPTDSDIYGTICRGVKAILPTAIVVINSDDPVTNLATTQCVLGDEERDVFRTLIGKEVIGMKVKLPEPDELQKERMAVMSRKLTKVPGNLFITMHNQVPEEICTKIEDALNIGDIYAIGLVSQGIILASLVIMLRKGERITHIELIESYITHASIALLRYRTEQTLKKSESRYRGIVEDQTEFVTRFLPDGTLTYVNDSLCRYFQKVRADLLGQSIFSLFLKEDQERMILDLHSLNADNPVRTTDNRLFDSGGRIRWTQWTNRALFEDHGAIGEYQGVGRDITEQKEADAKIRQYIADIEYLSQKSYEFLELPAEANIYKTICRGVKTILPKSIVLVNSIDLEKESATTEILLGDEARVIFRTLMKEDIVGKVVKLPKNELGEIAVKIVTSGKIVRVPGNLFIATQKHVPEEVCIKIEESLNIGDIFIIGLVSQGKILANVVIMLRKGDNIERVDLIEAYIHQAANALLRQITAERLRESEKLYRSVIENIQDVFYRSDKEGTLIMASPSWARMLGYDSLDDCIGHNIAEKFYFVPQRRKEFLDAVFRNGSVSDYEVTLKCRDGSPLQVLTNSHLYYDEAGLLLGVEGIFRDSSGRHAAARKMRDQEQKSDDPQRMLSSTAETFYEGIIGEKTDGTILSWNGGARQMFGYTEDEVLGHHISIIIPGDQQEENNFMRNQVKKGETIHNQKTHLMIKDGKIIDAEVTLTPIINENGIQIGQSIIARNISHITLKEQLKEGGEHNESRDDKEVRAGYPDTGDAGAGVPAMHSGGIVHQFPLSNALKMAQDYIAILDRTGKCMWANDALAGAVNAATCTDLEGKSIALYIAPEFRKIALDSLMEIKKSGNKTVQLMMLSSSGRIPVEANFSAINTEEGDLFGYMAIARNIERIKIEKPKR